MYSDPISFGVADEIAAGLYIVWNFMTNAFGF